MAKLSITERALERVFMHTKAPRVTIQGNITAMRYQVTSFDGFFFFISVPIPVLCWHGISHHVTWLETR